MSLSLAQIVIVLFKIKTQLNWMSEYSPTFFYTTDPQEDLTATGTLFIFYSI